MKHIITNARRTFLLALALLCLHLSLLAQDNPIKITQTLRGVIKDADAKIELPMVKVDLISTEGNITVLSDAFGKFKFDNVPVGRHSLVFSFTGYEEKFIGDIIVNSGKETVLEVLMTESIQKLDEVVIEIEKKHSMQNKDATVSAREFSVEETKRYAGSFSDPARMASSFAGVAGDPSGNNDVVIRGNSPKGVLWRMEGIEIPNPNHFASEGASGGPISVLNSNVMGKSDFFTSAFPSEFGNAYSGVFDLSLRKGNTEKREYAIGLNVLGLDAAAEGPLGKNGGSYLVNYRYSSLALLLAMGIEVAGTNTPKYQDAALKIVMPTNKLGTFTLFGMGGISGLNTDYYDELTDQKMSDGNFGADLGVLGLKNVYFLNDKTFLSTTVAMTGAQQYGIEDQLKIGSKDQFETVWNSKTAHNEVRTKVMLNHKFNSRHRVTGGYYYDQKFFSLHEKIRDKEADLLRTYLEEDGSTGLSQAFVNHKFRVTEKFTLISGLHYTLFHLNNDMTLEPRLGANWNVKKGHDINFGIGLHSRTESLSIYHVKNYDNNPSGELINKDLGMTKSLHTVLGYKTMLAKNLKFNVELYYQYLYDVPVAANGNAYSPMNSSEGYSLDKLVNEGTGVNYGIDVTLEKYFSNSYFFLVTGSLFDSKWKDLNGVERNTAFNSQYVFNVLGGKEFDISGKKSNRKLTVSIKGTTAGGRWDVPYDLEKSREAGYGISNEAEAFNYQYDDFVRFDFQLKVNTSRKKVNHEWMIDIQNITANENKTGEWYNPLTEKIEDETQMGLLPVIGYKITF